MAETFTAPLVFRVALPPTPIDPDICGVVVCASDESGFTPSSDNIVATHIHTPQDGPYAYVTVPRNSEDGKTFYFRFAWFDGFGLEPSLLNFSDEVEAVFPRADTPDLRPECASAWAVVTDDDPIDISAGYGVRETLLEQEFEPSGDFPVFINFRDVVVTNPTYASGEVLTVNYYLTVYREGSPTDVVFELAQQISRRTVHSFYGVPIDWEQTPSLQAVVNMDEGVTYTVRISWERTRQLNGTITAQSQERLLTIGALKR